MPRVSVLIPALNSASTLGATLDHLAEQSHRDFEVIVVENGPDRLGRSAVEARIPGATHLEFESAMLPHRAINRGLDFAQGELLAFTDADAYPAPDWLEQLLAAQAERGPVIIGAVADYGNGWISEAAHLCKFDKWLPGGSPRLVEEGPTVNMLIERSAFERVGPFAEDTIHADTDLSWRLRRDGCSLWFEPKAVVAHHHRHTFGSLLAERYRRGRRFARFERRWIQRGRGSIVTRAGASLVPLRLTNQLLRVSRNAAGAGMTVSFLRSWPIVALGLYAWLLGEAHGLLAANKGADEVAPP